MLGRRYSVLPTDILKLSIPEYALLRAIADAGLEG